MKKVFIILCLFFVWHTGIQAQTQPKFKFSFTIGDSSFLLNGKDMIIRCGEMHFARIPKEYWRHRLKMAKAMGLNAVCAYLFWNLHEPEPGKFNWEGIADAASFCEIAGEEGLWVILRPGPYSCAEWEFGGFPWWLLKENDIKLRTQDEKYMAAVRRYLLEVGRVLSPLQIEYGGPIIMAQVENEYGSYGNDKEYIGKVRDIMKEAGFKVPLFTCDGPSQLVNDVRDDIFSVVNFGEDPAGCFKALRKIRPKGPLMCGEYYPGWFDSWGQKHHYGNTDNIVKEIGYMLDKKASFSIYMVHGGTTFGQWSGANEPPFAPQTSSYDYDAPISEAGWETPKFQSLRTLLSKYLNPGESLTKVPERIPVISIPAFNATEVGELTDNLPYAVYTAEVMNMEAYNQGYGCILYRKTLTAGSEMQLVLRNMHDYGIVMLDGKVIASLDRRTRDSLVTIPARLQNAKLEILVEAMGRVNYGKGLHDRKGIVNGVFHLKDNETIPVKDWKVFNMNMDDAAVKKLKFHKIKGKLNPVPSFYKAEFQLNQTGDTFLDMKNWGKGLVWVNGHCLGRYWKIGPTQTMYVPGVWLNKGKNTIIISDLIGPVSTELSGLDKPVLDQTTESQKK